MTAIPLPFDMSSVLAALLLSVRLGIVLFMTPLLGGTGVPAHIRVRALLTLCLCLALGWQGGLPLAAGVRLETLPGLVQALLCEALWGALLGFGLSTAFATFLQGGRLLELQMGIGMSTLFDPATRSHAPMLGLLLQMTGIAAFLGMDGHHLVLRALAASLRAAPLAASPLGVPPFAVVAQFGLMFSLGLLLVGAAVVCVVLVDVGMSVVARVLPQANVFLLSIPVKLFAGLVLLALTAPALGPVLARIYGSVFSYWDQLLAR